MSQAFAMFRHALRMIFANFGATLRAIAPGLVLIVLAALAIYMLSTDLAEMMLARDNDIGQVLSGGGLLTILLGALVMFVGFVVMAIIWHRYVLLSEVEREGGLTPSAKTVGRYVWVSILLFLIIFLLSIPIMMVVGLVAAALASAPGPLVGLLGLLVGVVIGWIVMRLSLPLPAVAIGKRLSFGDSWRATQPVAVIVLWLSLGVSIFNQVIGSVVAAVISEPLFLAGSLQLIVTILTALISASVLTTLYGLCIEGREIG